MNANLIGVVARIINAFIHIHAKHWVFASDSGHSYREGAKYLIEYVLNKHPEIRCTFITKSREVYNYLHSKNIPCEMNTSLKGIITIAKADSIFYTQNRGDIDYAYKRKGRKYYYLVHGMPYKKAIKNVDKRIYMASRKARGRKNKPKWWNKMMAWLKTGFITNDVEFVSATSSFLQSFMKQDFGPSINVKVLGMPRNDALFDNTRMQNEKWVKEAKNKFVITYMPTHRLYGAGEISPTPFLNNPEIQNWLRQNNVLLIVKNHPNMIYKMDSPQQGDWFIDITRKKIDPQVCLFHSDIIITDFSSVWIDFLLLKRPILFYLYDDFEKNDVGTYYDIRKEFPNHVCSSETELFELIKLCKNKYDEMRPKDEIVQKYHKYIDSNSCERYYKEIYKQYT